VKKQFGENKNKNLSQPNSCSSRDSQLIEKRTWKKTKTNKGWKKKIKKIK
jgi:hypothetical protein